MIEVVNPSSMSTPTAAYSQGVAGDNFVFVAGQVALDADGNVVGGDDVAAQTRQAIANVEAVLNAAGAGLEDVVSTTVYLTSFDGYNEYDQAYAECFGHHRPARATVRADLVLPELLVEIQAIAYRARP